MTWFGLWRLRYNNARLQGREANSHFSWPFRPSCSYRDLMAFCGSFCAQAPPQTWHDGITALQMQLGTTPASVMNGVSSCISTCFTHQDWRLYNALKWRVCTSTSWQQSMTWKIIPTWLWLKIRVPKGPQKWSCLILVDPFGLFRKIQPHMRAPHEAHEHPGKHMVSFCPSKKDGFHEEIGDFPEDVLFERFPTPNHPSRFD